MKADQQPLFIVSEQWADAVYMSLLLSNHIEWPDEVTPKRPFTTQDNYFSNEQVADLFSEEEIAEDHLPDVKLQLEILLQEGFDSERRRGVMLSSTLFNALCNETLVQQAKHIVLSETSTSITVDELRITIPVLLLQSKPRSILYEIAHFLNVNVVHEAKIKPQELRSDSFWLQKPSVNYHGHACLVIFYIDYNLHIDAYLKRLKELYCTVLHELKIVLILHSEEEQQLLEKKVAQTFHKNYPHSLVRTISTTQVINSIITNDQPRKIIIDNLHTVYSFDSLLNTSLLGMAMPMMEEENRKLRQVDFWEECHADYASSFTFELFTELGGFDQALDHRFIQLDFAIRFLLKYTLVETVPSTAAVMLKSGTLASLMEHKDVLNQILIKYDETVSNMATKESHNRDLHDRMIRMKTLLSHKEQELSSIQELSGQLHQRIQYLEGNWYFKLKHKAQRIKKIFFKKKTPGKDGAKRIIQFLRFAMSKTGFGMVRKAMASVFKKLYLFTEKRNVRLVFEDEVAGADVFTYHDWLKKKLDPDTLKENLKEFPLLPNPKPLLSIIMPVYNPPVKFLKEAIESVLKQSYTHWELCMADDCSPEPKVLKLLKVYAAKDARIKVHFRKTNGHISATSNDALNMAQGEFVLMMDHDDLLTENCLTEVVRCIQQHPQADFIYSDEDKIDEAHQHQQAHFKPDWSPDNLLSRNYIGHVSVLRKSLIDAIGGFRIGFEGSQDYDLFLRATERTAHIYHIPKVLYHWRIHGSSAASSEAVKPYAYMAAKRALQEALTRRGLKGDVKYLSGLRGYRIDYQVVDEEMVSIIIPTKDQVELLKNTIDSIMEKTTYQRFELIVLNNNSSTKQFDAWRTLYTEKYQDVLTIIDAPIPFNFARLMNIGASYAKGKYLLFLNNDVEVIHADWLHTLVSYAQQKRVGIVGAKLLYPDDTIQHAGVIVGLGGIAGHAFVGSYKDDPGYFNYIQSVNNFSALTAACVLLRKEIFDEVQGMNELFEVEYNDVDFCLRIKEAGYDNVYVPQVELYHYESATRGHPHQNAESYKRHLKEMDLFKAYWQRYIDHDPHYNPNLNYGAHDFRINFSA